MGISPDMKVGELGRLGARLAKPLKDMGIATAGDLLRHYPFRYDDFSAVCPLGSAPIGRPVTVSVRIDMIRSRRSANKKMTLTEAMVSDATREAKVVWFRQPFIAKALSVGERVRLSGTVERKPWGLEMVSPVYEKEGVSVHTGRLVPIYPLSNGITAKQLRALIHMALPAADRLEESLPPDLLDRHGLAGLPEAIRGIHFPETKEEADAADRRFRFEELFRFQLRGAWARRLLEVRSAPPIPIDEDATRAFVLSLPFRLTDGQKKAAWRILQDIARPMPMQRLLEGDVGSGKTVVAAIAMHACALDGRAAFVMAPTEILAEQHHATLSKLFAGTPYEVAIRTRTRREPVGQAKIVVGTHALLEEKLELPEAALVVVDEQHRFGVGQRHRLLDRLAGEDGRVPHFLSMTATPIPRTLTLALYGGVDFSALRELPAGRKPVETALVGDFGRKRMIDDLKAEMAAGRKVFVICPLIEPSDVTGAKSAEEEAERLKREAFPETEIGLLHGRMKAEAKRETMERFAKGDLHCLVSTTVVEVGVDVPLATRIVIENAERFGLAQLHQLRGRVGRNDLPSRCYLAASEASPEALERLEAFARAKDCFEIADLDLRFRGPGSLLGESQSGFDDLRHFDPSDVALMEEAKEAALALLRDDPDLARHAGLRKAVTREAETVHLE